MSRKARQRGIFLALLVGIATLVFAWAGGSARAGRTTQIVEATQNLQAGEILSVSDLTTATVYNQGTSGYVTGIPSVQGKPLLYDVVKGQPIMKSDISGTVVRQGLGQGQVGVFLPVNLASSAEVVPGDYVDVVWTGSASTAASQGSAGFTPGTTILTHAKVISVVTSNGAPVAATTASGSTVGSYAASVPSAVELAVPQFQAPDLAEAAASGTLWLVVDPWGVSSTAPAYIPPSVTVPATNSPSGTSKGTTTKP